MPGRLRASGISGCFFFLTARSAEADFRQEIQDSGKYFLEHHFAQAVPVTRGQGQSPALEGGEHANLRATPHLPRGGRFRKSGRLEPALSHDNQALAVFLLKGTRAGSVENPTPPLAAPPPCGLSLFSPYGKKCLRSAVPGLSIHTKFSSDICVSPRFQR